MKQIVLMLLFILTLQKKIHTDPPKDLPKDRYHYKTSSYRISPNQECPSGYYKNCFVIGMYRGTKNLPKTCYCFEKKTQKINRILKEISSTKDKTTKNKPIKDRLPKDKYFPFRRKLEYVEKNSKRCNGDYYVCYSYTLPTRSFSKCHCSKFPA